MSESKTRRPHWRKRPALARDEILRLADGSRTAEDIAIDIGSDAAYVATVCREHGGKLKFSKNCPNSPWTDEAIAILKRMLCVEGHSFSRIAAVIGVTRNAAIGKAKRLDLMQASAKPRAAVRLPKPKRERILPAKKIVQLRSLPAEPLPAPRIEDIARKTLAQLEPEDCRYPIDLVGGGFGFCALEKVPGISYCAAHAARCLIPAKPRQPAPAAAPVPEVVS